MDFSTLREITLVGKFNLKGLRQHRKMKKEMPPNHQLSEALS
jgi:hypothetical protein